MTNFNITLGQAYFVPRQGRRNHRGDCPGHRACYGPRIFPNNSKSFASLQNNNNDFVLILIIYVLIKKQKILENIISMY